MPVPDKPLPERLLDLERPDPARREQYELAVRDMLELKLTGFRKWSWLASAVASIAIAVYLVVQIFLAPRLPLAAKAGLAGGAVFSLGWAGLAIRLVKQGALSRKRDPVLLAGLIWIAMVLMETMFMLLAMEQPTAPHATLIVTVGLVFLLSAGVQLLRSVVEQGEVRTREKLLEIEYRVTQLAEALARQSRDGPSHPKENPL
jgi:hypothetical protein